MIALKKQTELLAPARDLACGRAAIDAGADAVYVGAPRFGARARVGNTLDDIAALADYAHRYWARVYVTVNTLLTDHELPAAVRLIHNLYEIGVDGIIIQDVGLLECDLPPIPLIASTQMHNDTPAKVAFLEKVGLQRLILARELSLEQIRAIRAQTTVELEVFVHGALCVSYSGQCCMSYAVGGRSGNRGECAQPCRRVYDLVDSQGRTLVGGRHLLSLRDLYRAPCLGELIEAGVSAFKIEGRLKDQAYVMNVVGYYRQRLDEALAQMGLSKSSSGRSHLDWEPDVTKTFNRGYTSYYLHGREEPPGAIDTPKMVGEALGRAIRVEGKTLWLDGSADLHTGDGLCFFDRQGVLAGTVVNRIDGEGIGVEDAAGIEPGMPIYRNRDHVFLSRLEGSRPERRIAVHLIAGETQEGLDLRVRDEDGNEAAVTLAGERVAANKPDQMLETVQRQLAKTGDTEFVCAGVEVAWPEVYFLPFSALNDWRRRVLDRLREVRAQNRPRPEGRIVPNDTPYPEQRLTYHGNVLNEQAATFYRRHGVTQIEPAAESGLDMEGRQVMRCRYCIKHQLGYCPTRGRQQLPPDVQEPLYLVDEDGHRYRLEFDCRACEMEVYF